jgi:acyl transferase domain-containing protein
MSMTTETEGRIAIIGLSGRFPGAQDVAAFWRNLRDGVESVTFFADDQLEDGADPATRASAGYVKARPVLADVDQFDAGFFDMREREAALTDPQHRVFLECAWEALEDAGYDPGAYRDTICVFAGCSMNTYFLNNICRDRKAIEDFTGTFQVGDYPVLIGAGREFLASRVSYKLDLRGPSLTIQTACSTSLVAVAQACQACCCIRRTWRWLAACRSRFRNIAAICIRKAAWCRWTVIAARSTHLPAERSSAAARASSC